MQPALPFDSNDVPSLEKIKHRIGADDYVPDVLQLLQFVRVYDTSKNQIKANGEPLWPKRHISDALVNMLRELCRDPKRFMSNYSDREWSYVQHMDIMQPKKGHFEWRVGGVYNFRIIVGLLTHLMNKTQMQIKDLLRKLHYSMHAIGQKAQDTPTRPLDDTDKEFLNELVSIWLLRIHIATHIDFLEFNIVPYPKLRLTGEFEIETSGQSISNTKPAEFTFGCNDFPIKMFKTSAQYIIRHESLSMITLAQKYCREGSYKVIFAGCNGSMDVGSKIRLREILHVTKLPLLSMSDLDPTGKLTTNENF